MFLSAEPSLAMHQCPMHDGAMHGMSGAMHAHRHSSDTPSSSHECTCLGDCCIALFGALPARALALRAQPGVALPRQLVRFDDTYRPLVVAHTLPFANGPPAAIRA